MHLAPSQSQGHHKMKFDHVKFIELCGGEKLQAGQRDGLLFLLTSFENDEAMTDIRWIAYCFATIQRECGNTYQPIEEYGKGKGKPYGAIINGHAYYGRGYTQNTWIENYKMLTRAWNKQHPDRKLNFVTNPELLCVPEYAYWAMSYAMRTDAYTGVGLDEFIKGDKCDYLHCRKVINGMDHAAEIAKVAEWFEKVLRECQL